MGTFQREVAVTRNHPWILLNPEIGPLGLCSPKSARVPQTKVEKSQNPDHDQAYSKGPPPARCH